MSTHTKFTYGCRNKINLDWRDSLEIFPDERTGQKLNFLYLVHTVGNLFLYPLEIYKHHRLRCFGLWQQIHQTVGAGGEIFATKNSFFCTC